MTKNISIVGSGWLGLPLAKRFASLGYHLKASTTSADRFQELSTANIEPFLLDICQLPPNLPTFLQAHILIVNIPFKNVDSFSQLIKAIEDSTIKRVIFVSSTSVYKNANKTIIETDTEVLIACPLLSIEKLFQKNSHFITTIVRFGGLIGYSRAPGNFFKKGMPIKKPDSNVNLIHRDDCINIICQIVEQGCWNEVFNCCADTHPSKRQFYTQAAIKIGVSAPYFDDSGSNEFKIISNQKVKQVLDYQFLYADLMKVLN